MNTHTHRAPSSTHQIPVIEIQVFRNLVRTSGRDPAAFIVDLQPDGQVHVRGPRGIAFYETENWIPRFSKHLERGFYDDTGRPPVAPRGHGH